MAYQALYRKWRPQTFEEVLGQTATVRTLRRQIQTGRIAHAYLFCGCRGTGKTTMAKLMSRAINCQNPKEGDPCGECEVCRAIQGETTLDVVEYDAASNSRVEEIREILSQVPYPPQVAKYKVYIIDEVHMLSASAFNALLKTLEEPPPHIVFILATTEPQKLPATILSRVQRYDFGRIPTALMVERMRQALEDMNITAEDEALHMVAQAAEGAMRDAFSILDMCVSGAEGGAITAEVTRDILGTSDKGFLYTFFDALAQRDESAVMRFIDQMMRSGRDPQTFLRELAAHTRELLTVRAIPDGAATVLDITAEDETRCREQAKAFSTARLLRMLDRFTAAESELRYASTPRIGLESAALHACEEVTGEDAPALAEKLEELQNQVAFLQEQLKKGVVVAAAEKTDTPVTRSAPRKQATASEPADPAPVDKTAVTIWDEARKLLKKEKPAIYGLLAKARFAGAEGDTYKMWVNASDPFTLTRLRDSKQRTTVEDALTRVAGKPLHFEAVPEQTPEAPAAAGDGEQKLVEIFGRENVHITDG